MFDDIQDADFAPLFKLKRDIRAEESARAFASQYGMAYVDLACVSIPPCILKLIPREMALSEFVLPLFESAECLTVVIPDASAEELKDKLRFVVNRNIEFAVAPRSYLQEVVTWYYDR
jgi:type IV pilus assembly protein PilB